jgi:hypothetical protein
MIAVVLLTLLVAAALGVCGWVDMIDRIWLIAGAGAAMVALFAMFTLFPIPTRGAERTFPYWFVGAFLVALTLNVTAVFVGRAVKRRQESPPQQS